MKNKVFSLVLIFALIVFTLTVSVSALSFTATMTPSATTVDESTEFTITVKVSNLDVGTNGINSLSGFLKYDTEVFDTITESSIEGLNSWSSTFDESTGKITLTKNTFVKSTQEVFQITFKTKEGVTGQSGTISYSDIVASNSETDISATEISTSITVGTAAATDSDTSNTTSNVAVVTANTVTINTVTSTNTTENNTVENNTTENTSNNALSSYVNTMTNTNSESDMPDTGVDDTVLFLIFATVGIALIFYIKIEKLNKDIR